MTLSSAPSKAALIGHWDFDGDSNNRAAGSIGAMQLAGDAQLSSAQVAPANGGSHSLAVDGSGDYAFLDAAAGRADLYDALSGSFTVSAWGRSDVAAASSGKDLLYLWDIGSSHGTGTGTFFASGHGVGTNGEIGAYYNSGTGIHSGMTGNANTWYHVVLTGDGTDVRLYVDGDEKGSRSQGGSFNTGYDFRVGAEAKSGGRAWEGYLDDVAVWDHTLSAQQIAQLHDGTINPLDTPPGAGDQWVWEDQMFDDSNTSIAGQAAGPWINSARWRYKSDNGDTDTVWDDATITDFPDLEFFDTPQTEWQMNSSDNYPQVRTSDTSLHTGSDLSGTENYDIVSAWEADFTGHVTVDYEAGSGNSIGYQLLQWDQSRNEMRVLQTRQTYQNTGFGPLHELTRVEPGDQILVVLDGDGDNGNNDRIRGFSKTVTVSDGPALGTQWDFQADQFDDTSLTTASGPWENSAHWVYMMNDRSADDTYSDLSGMIEFETLSGNRWQMYASDWPDVQLDGTIHPGDSASPDPDTNVIVAWEADFDGAVDIEYALTGGSIGYQLLQWDESLGSMLELQSRAVYTSGGSDELLAHAGVQPGDMLLWIVDNNGTYGNDRVTFDALITAVPEPGTAALALLGLLGWAGIRRRRFGN
jgi:hypothetical protein